VDKARNDKFLAKLGGNMAGELSYQEGYNEE
jgi:hypothetical protein